MEITFLGYISIALTVFYILKNKPIYFLYSAVFFAGFSGASVVNFEMAGGLSVQPSYYFYALYIFYELLCLFQNGKLRFRLSRLLVLFVIYCSISIYIPFVINWGGQVKEFSS